VVVISKEDRALRRTIQDMYKTIWWAVLTPKRFHAIMKYAIIVRLKVTRGAWFI
jgi:hypothetical protein